MAVRGRALFLPALLVLAACGSEARPHPAHTDAGVVLPGGTLDRRAHLGQLIYARHCAICHGEGGAGDGFNSYNLEPRPADLRGIVDERGADHVRTVILDGSVAIGRSPLCPPRRHTLRREEPELVLAFLRTLKAPPPE